ncbi:MAG: class I SAM-dependent methyltransferase [Actinomycetota bacterium]|nr:class I SAM-dependent methyltransferase [Actinomycetota bacterium]
MEGWKAGTYGAVHAGVYDDWYADGGRFPLTASGTPEEVASGVSDLVAETGNGPILELGVGTGRLALPLAERGLEVTGLDASSEMLDRLRAKPHADRLTLLEGDMSALSNEAGLVGRSFALVLIGFNTLFCLTTAKDQASCIAGAAELLAPGGRLVVEAFVPDPDAHEGVSIRAIEADAVVLDIARFNRESQEITGSRVEISGSGNRLFPYYLRYATPDQIDLMATTAGLMLQERWADWSSTPFDEESPGHVSIWSKPSTLGSS